MAAPLDRGIARNRLQAEIAPFDRSGIRAQEMLSLMRSGLYRSELRCSRLSARTTPEFNAVDLPIVNPDMATLRRTVASYRPHIEAVLAERYDVELLAVYTYPAQVVFAAMRLWACRILRGGGAHRP